MRADYLRIAGASAHPLLGEVARGHEQKRSNSESSLRWKSEGIVTDSWIKLCRVVQLDLTPEIEVFCMLFILYAVLEIERYTKECGFLSQEVRETRQTERGKPRGERNKKARFSRTS